MSGWELFSSHGLVLIYFSRHPRARLRDAAEAIGLTERAVQNNIRDLAASGHLVIEKVGRRNRYRVVGRKHLTHPTTRSVSLRQLLQLFKISEVKTAALKTPVKKASVGVVETPVVIQAQAQSVAEPARTTKKETSVELQAVTEEIAEQAPVPETEVISVKKAKAAKFDKPAKIKDNEGDGLPQQDLLF